MEPDYQRHTPISHSSVCIVHTKSFVCVQLLSRQCCCSASPSVDFFLLVEGRMGGGLGGRHKIEETRQ